MHTEDRTIIVNLIKTIIAGVCVAFAVVIIAGLVS